MDVYLTFDTGSPVHPRMVALLQRVARFKGMPPGNILTAAWAFDVLESMVNDMELTSTGLTWGD